MAFNLARGILGDYEKRVGLAARWMFRLQLSNRTVDTLAKDDILIFLVLVFDFTFIPT